MIVAVDIIIIFINRDGGAFSNVSGGGGGWGGTHLPLSHTHTLTQNFQNANLFAILTVSSVSVVSCSGGPASWCFLGSS